MLYIYIYIHTCICDIYVYIYIYIYMYMHLTKTPESEFFLRGHFFRFGDHVRVLRPNRKRRSKKSEFESQRILNVEGGFS